MVAIIGMPNAGKSSLLNQLIETKLSIVTAAAQTTRERVVGIDTRDGVQMVFLDTPGIVEPGYLLHHSMLHIIEQALADADVVLLLLDGSREPPELPAPIEEFLQGRRETLVVAANKADVAPASSMAAVSTWSEERFGLAPRPISARTGDGVEALRADVAARLPESPFLYPDDDISTQSVRFFVAELIRETVFEQYEDEIPYSTAVRVEEFREEADPIYIRAVVFVERASQKGILIGKRGAAIRELGAAARAKVEEFVGRRVYLDLWIKVLPKWRKSPLELARLGFPLPQNQED